MRGTQSRAKRSWSLFYYEIAILYLIFVHGTIYKTPFWTFVYVKRLELFQSQAK